MVNLSKIAKNLRWLENLNIKPDPSKEKFRFAALEGIAKECENLPSGSGLDNGVRIDLERSKPNKIVFHTEFHHLNENGYYDGWTTHRIVVTPNFGRFNLKITGRNRNQIKDYLYDLFYDTFECRTS